MRYVIVVCAVTAFIIWDGIYNSGQMLDHFARQAYALAAYFGL